MPSLLFGVPSASHPPGASRRRALPALGFRPSSRPHRDASTFREASHFLATIRPRAFSAPRRFSPRLGLRASFIPLPRPGFPAVQGFLPPCSLFRLVAGSFPLAVVALSLTASGCHVRAPRLRGFSLQVDALRRFGLTLSGARSPLRVSSSLGLSPPSPGPAFLPGSARGVSPVGLASVAFGFAFSVSIDQGSRPSVSR